MTEGKASKQDKKAYLRPKKCEDCILRKLGDQYECDGGFKAGECIGILQGAIERLAENKNYICNPDGSMTNVAQVRVDYMVHGEGSIYISGDPSSEEIITSIYNDCDDKWMSIEYFDQEDMR